MKISLSFKKQSVLKINFLSIHFLNDLIVVEMRLLTQLKP
jgi:hypothetical protein